MVDFEHNCCSRSLVRFLLHLYWWRVVTTSGLSKAVRPEVTCQSDSGAAEMMIVAGFDSNVAGWADVRL